MAPASQAASNTVPPGSTPGTASMDKMKPIGRRISLPKNVIHNRIIRVRKWPKTVYPVWRLVVIFSRQPHWSFRFEIHAGRWAFTLAPHKKSTWYPLEVPE